MKKLLTILLVTLTACVFPVSAQSPQAPKRYPGCTVQVFQSGPKPTQTRRVYVCETETPAAPTTVTKAWFKQNCHVYSDGSVTCTQFAPTEGPFTALDVNVKDAAAPSVWKKRFEDIAIGGAITVIIAACIAGGGCGAFAG